MGCGGVVVCHRNARVRGVRDRSVGVYAHLILPLALTPLIRVGGHGLAASTATAIPPIDTRWRRWRFSNLFKKKKLRI